MLVLDVSVGARWFFAKELTDYARAALHLIEREGAVVPALFLWEMENTLIRAERTGRLTAADVDRAFRILHDLPIAVERLERIVAGKELDLARCYRLTPYDATYLALALRHRAMLATEDARLAAAAADLGVLFEPN